MVSFNKHLHLLLCSVWQDIDHKIWKMSIQRGAFMALTFWSGVKQLKRILNFLLAQFNQNSWHGICQILPSLECPNFFESTSVTGVIAWWIQMVELWDVVTWMWLEKAWIYGDSISLWSNEEKDAMENMRLRDFQACDMIRSFLHNIQQILIFLLLIFRAKRPYQKICCNPSS